MPGGGCISRAPGGANKASTLTLCPLCRKDTMGLVIAKEAVERHGGQITVHSVVGEGSTFSVSLPRGPG